MSSPFISDAFNRPPFAPPLAPAPSQLIDELASLVERRTMMQFAVERRTHFVNIVTARARAAGMQDVTAYVKRLLGVGAEAEIHALIDDLTINETTFFRNVPQIEMVSRVAIPEIVARKQKTSEPKVINIWSAACSTGQEVYTLAIVAFEALRFLPQWDVRVTGTDISPTVIEAARRGIYPKARLDTMPQNHLRFYFDDAGDQISVRDPLRRKVSFQQHNLRDVFPTGPFDIIFCRNVMIYFSRDEQAKLAARFKERLTTGGFLFIGHSETLQGLGVDYRLRIEDRGIAYQKE